MNLTTYKSPLLALQGVQTYFERQLLLNLIALYIVYARQWGCWLVEGVCEKVSWFRWDFIALKLGLPPAPSGYRLSSHKMLRILSSCCLFGANHLQLVVRRAGDGSGTEGYKLMEQYLSKLAGSQFMP